MHVLFPFNPYRWNGPSDRGLNRLDERDEGARQLVEIIDTPEYRTAVLTAALGLAAILWVMTSICAFLFRNSLNWRPISSWFLFGVGGGVLFCWMFVRVRVIAWALSTWWARYSEASEG